MRLTTFTLLFFAIFSTTIFAQNVESDVFKNRYIAAYMSKDGKTFLTEDYQHRFVLWNVDGTFRLQFNDWESDTATIAGVVRPLGIAYPKKTYSIFFETEKKKKEDKILTIKEKGKIVIEKKLNEAAIGVNDVKAFYDPDAGFGLLEFFKYDDNKPVTEYYALRPNRSPDFLFEIKGKQGLKFPILSPSNNIALSVFETKSAYGIKENRFLDWRNATVDFLDNQNGNLNYTFSPDESLLGIVDSFNAIVIDMRTGIFIKGKKWSDKIEQQPRRWLPTMQRYINVLPNDPRNTDIKTMHSTWIDEFRLPLDTLSSVVKRNLIDAKKVKNCTLLGSNIVPTDPEIMQYPVVFGSKTTSETPTTYFIVTIGKGGLTGMQMTYKGADETPQTYNAPLNKPRTDATNKLETMRLKEKWNNEIQFSTLTFTYNNEVKIQPTTSDGSPAAVLYYGCEVVK